MVQEVSLAQSAALVCGRLYLDFDDLLRAYDRMRQLEARLFELDLNIYPAMANIEQSLGLFRDCRRQLSDAKSAVDYKNRDFTAFIGLLTMCRGQLSTEPKDKIYGLLGLVSESLRHRIHPRYDLDTMTLLKDFAMIVLQDSGSLFILSQAIRYWFDDAKEPRAEKPSWLPLWTANGIRQMEYEQAKYRLRQETLFCACGLSNVDNFILTGGDLRLREITIDQISSSTTFSRWQEGLFNGIPDLDFLRQWLQLPRESDVELQGSDLASTFWRTWAHDQEPFGNEKHFRRCATGFPSTCEYWRQQYTRWEDSDGDMQLCQGFEFNFFYSNLWRNTDNSLHQSRFFISDRGFLGLTGRGILPGDKICVLAGARLPFILRPVSADSDRFTLICECFVEGIMDGEATTDPRWSCATRSELQEELHDSVHWQDIILV